MKVLLTGCTASQSSPRLGTRLPTFQGLLSVTLTNAGHDVVWDNPSMRWGEDYLSTFDSVVVGLSSPTSIASHRLYGALSVIERAKNVTNVRYLIDAPNPHKIWHGIKAIIDNPDNLVKDFYSRRSEFSLASTDKNLARLLSVLNNLYNNQWENTIVPAFPWSESSHITQYIPNLSEDTVKLLCLDSILLTAMSSSSIYMKSESTSWSYDSYTPWVKSVEKTIINPAHPMARSKWSNNVEILANLNKSIGCLISTHKNNNPWWSVNLSQSLFVNTPVVTDWRHTNYLGSEWSFLAHQVEEMPLSERTKLAFTQKNSYIKAISNFEDATERVLSSVF